MPINNTLFHIFSEIKISFPSTKFHRLQTCITCTRNKFLFITVIRLFCIGLIFKSSVLWAQVNPIGPEVMKLPPHWSVTGTGGMVAAANPYASAAGLEILRAGGNAIDALLAVQWALNVVEPQSSGIGGGGFILYYDASAGKVHAIDGREESPAGLNISDFNDSNGNLISFYPERVSSPMSVGVPGTVSMMAHVHNRFSQKKVTWAKTFERAIRLAENGFRLPVRFANALEANHARMRQSNSTGSFFPDGKPMQAGQVIRQKDLGNTLRLLAQKGPQVFYQGEIGRDIVTRLKEVSSGKSRMSESDLKRYQTVEREAVSSIYRGYEIFTMPAPSSGMVILQSLAMREQFAVLHSSGNPVSLNTSLGLHLKLETEKLAFADRDQFFADPDFSVFRPASFLSPEYIFARCAKIVQTSAMNVPVEAGVPKGYGAEPSVEASDTSEQTTHVVIVDSQGNVASMTSTIEHSFGSAILVPGRGFYLNNELTDFTFIPGAANAPSPELRRRTSALNAEASGLGGKRPRSSMSPVIVFKNKKFYLTLGSPGGSQIPGAITSVLLRVLDDNEDIQSAVNAPRMLHRNGKYADAEWPYWQNKKLLQELQALGHSFAEPSQWNISLGGVQAILRDPKTGILWGAADLRREGKVFPVNSGR